MNEIYIVADKSEVVKIFHFTEADISVPLKNDEFAFDNLVSERVAGLRSLGFGNFATYSTEEEAIKAYNHRKDFLELLKSLS